MNQLNPQQLAAVTHGSGPLLIIAGAGTGKTTVIVERIKWLIAEGLAQPSEILGLTFTEKASLEMQTRLDEVMPLGYTRMWIMTFHGFCESLLREHALDIGLDPQFKVLTQIDSVALLKKHFFEFELDYYRPLGNPHKFLNAITTFFSRLCDEDVSPLEFSKWAKGQEEQKYQELAKLRLQFQKIKEEKGVLDFGDLISYTLHLLEKRPKILETYRQKFKYVLVDEFQDTNFAQIKLIKLLLNKNQNITVVADDDQAIYQWRGAATGNVVAFQKSFPKIKLVTLNQNYRSTQIILDHAHQLISFNNPDRLEIAAGIDKKLISQDKKAWPAIEVLSAQTASAEAELIAQKIAEILDIGNLTLKDFAILVRANNHAEPFIKSLENLGVPAQFLGPGKLFLQPEIKDLLALLRLINDPGDNTACYRVLKMTYWQIPGTELTQILASSARNEVLKSAQESKDKAVINFINLYQRALENIHVKSPGETLYVFLEESGMLKDMLDYKLPISETQAKNISKFFNKIKQFETENPDTSLSGLLEWIDLSLELGESPAAVLDSDWSLNDAVNILTYHSAKGLEFPVVFMVNLVTGRFPSLNRKDPIEVPVELIKEISPVGDPHIQEERRLFYVGMTRAKNQLFFSLAQSYGEGIREKKPSPFIFEALGKDVNISPVDNHLSKTEHRVPSTEHQLKNKVTYITYSQIQTFLDCPLHYKAKYILHLPTPPSAASSFGNAIHATLNTFFKDPKADILKTFKSHWKNEGFENKKHEELYFQKGEQYLTKFISQNPPPYPNTIKLEESFKFFLGDLTVSGKIDRVDTLPDGKIEIIDYKTSPKMLTPKEAATDLQLSIYALAATKLQEKPFAKKPEDIILSLYYLDTQTKITTTRTQQQLDDAEKQILDYVSQIESSDFKCSGSFICQKCDFASLCDTIATS